MSALISAESKVKSLSGRTIPLNFKVTGLESLTGINKKISGSTSGVKSVTADIDNLGKAIKRVSTTNSDGSTKSVEKYNTALGQTVQLTEKVSEAKGRSTSKTVTQIDTSEKELKQLGQKEKKLIELSRIESRYGDVVDKNALSASKSSVLALDPTDVNFSKKYEQASQSINKVKSAAQDATYAQNQLAAANKKNLLSVDNIKESMGTAAIRTVEWAVSMGALYGAFNAVKSMVTTSSAIADQMTSIKMVTGASDAQIKTMLGTYQSLATELSSTTSAVAASAEVWVRQGRSISDTNDLIKTSTVLSKVGFMDSATSAQLLTSSINGYGIAAKDAMSVVDKMSAIDVNAATSTEDLAVAMAQTASGAKIAGVSMDELLSYIATISDVTQASGDTIGVSLKTMFARINSVKLGSLTDGEGEDISRVETALKQYGITLRETNGTAKDTGDILDELSVKWGTLTGLQKSEIAMQMAGVHQKEKFLVLMENYNKALKYQDIAANSAGSAMQKMSIWEESTEAATQRLTNQWEILSTKMVDSNFTKAIINLGTLSLSALSSDFGQLAIKISMVAAALVALSAIKGKASSAWGAVDIVGGSGMLVGIKKVAEAQKAYKALGTAVEATGDTIKTVGNVAEGVGDTIEGVGDVTEKFGKNTFSSKVATQGLGSTLKDIGVAALPVAAMLALVAGGLWAADVATVSFSEHIENIGTLKTKLSDNKSEIDSLTSSLDTNRARIKEIKSMGTITTVDASEITRLELSNQQLQTKIDALKQIDTLTTKQMSEEAMAALNQRSADSIKDDTGLVSKGVMPATKLTPIESLKEQMEEVKNIEDQLADLQTNRSKYSSEDWLKQYDSLSKKQEEYSQKANQTALTLNDLAASIDGTTDEGKSQLKIIDDLNKQLIENNKLVGLSGSSTSKSNAEISSNYKGAQAQDLEKVGGYLNVLESGLSGSLTESENFKLSLMTMFSDINPPTDVVAGLENLKMLFSQDEAYAGKFLETVNNFKTESGNFNLKELQNQFNLSDTAIATVNARLQEMGLLMSTSATDGVWSLGNGLGLASDDSVEFELQLNKMSTSVKNGSMSFADAESSIRSYLESMGVTSGKIEQVVDDFSMLSEGASEFNLLAFTGLTGEGELANVSQAAESQASNYVNTFKDYFQSELSKGTELGDIKMDLGFGASADTLKENIAQTLRETGLFAEEQITQLSEQISSNTINANFNIVAEGIISELNIQDTGVQDQLRTILQANFNSETQTFDIPSVVAQVGQLQVEGVDSSQLASQIQPMLEGVNAEMTVAANTDAAVEATTEVAKPEDKTITAKADTAAARSAFDALVATEYKTIIVNEQIGSKVDVSDTTKTVYVNEVSSNAAAGNMGTYANNATGSININTSQAGTMSVVGEEGEEALLRNGKLTYIGTKGAEIIPIQDGDTILPADITKRIKSGQIPMYAQGKYSVTENNKGSYGQDVWDYRSQSSIWSGLPSEPPEDEEAKKAYEAHKDAFQKEFDYIQHLKEMGELSDKDYYAWLDKINKSYFQGKNEYLDEYRQHEEEVYKFLKEQEKERLEDLNDSYDATISAVTEIIDGQIEAIKGEDDLAEAYEKVADAQEKVDNLKDQKNQRIYTEGIGWQWVSNDTDLKEAQTDLEDAQKDVEVAKLEAYKAKWEEIAKNYENEQNNIDAENSLGDDYLQKILSGDTSILKDFANKYSSSLSDLSQVNGENAPSITYDDTWTLTDPYKDGVKNLLTSSNIDSLAAPISSSIVKNLNALSNVSSLGSAVSTTNETNFNIASINLENVTDFDSFITEATQYAKVKSAKR